MRVLVACEFSGIVREAFKAKGHDAWSCDLLPTEIPGQHLQVDVLGILDECWDLMIAHPPCTHLTVSGARWFKGKESQQEYSLNFVRKLLDAPIHKIALENPIGIISTRIRKPDQIIQPWQFGVPESKATCLWLNGIPKLAPTNILEKRHRWENQTPGGHNKFSPSPDRWMKRSRTYKNIADAMADQWG